MSKDKIKTQSITRRDALKGLLAVGAGLLLPMHLQAAPGIRSPQLTALATNIRELIGEREVGLDLRQVNAQTGTPYFRIPVNADKLYPVASCFKTWLALYYFWHVSASEWLSAEGSTVYSVVVFSNNTLTGTLLAEVGERVDIYGNVIEKFNDFLIYTVGMQNGLYRWNWEGNPVEDVIDRRFSPSLSDRYVEIYSVRYEMDNLFTAADLADGYAFLLQAGEPTYRPALDATIQLASIPAAAYIAPIERVFTTTYTGKDGVLPADTSVIGRVINDAGIIQVGAGTYILSIMCAGEGEFECIAILREIAGLLRAYEDAR